jgi:hypothetical protein
MRKSKRNDESLVDARQLAHTIESDPRSSESARELARKILTAPITDDLSELAGQLAFRVLSDRDPVMKEFYELAKTPIQGNWASDALMQMRNFMADEQAAFLSSSIPFFANALKLLLPYVQGIKRVRLGTMKGDLAANAESHRGQCFGYRIKVHPNLYVLFRDAVELVFSRNVVVRPTTGEILKHPTLTNDEHLSALREAIQAFVENDYGWTPSPGLSLSRYKRHRDQLVTGIAQRTDAVEAMYIEAMIEFAVAHELGHIASGHCDLPIPEEPERRRQLELEADIAAIPIFLKRISGRVASVPPAVLAKSMDEFNQYVPGAMTSCSDAEQFLMTEYFSGVASLFTIYELTERAARELGRPWDDRYPSGKLRYQTFRTRCIELGISNEVFSDADGVHARLCNSSEQISWN